jgi:hypothetical protein
MIIDFSTVFDLVPHVSLLKKIAPIVEVWVKEFLLGCSQRRRVDGQLSQEVIVTSGLPLGSI